MSVTPSHPRVFPGVDTPICSFWDSLQQTCRRKTCTTALPSPRPLAPWGSRKPLVPLRPHRRSSTVLQFLPTLSMATYRARSARAHARHRAAGGRRSRKKNPSAKGPINQLLVGDEWRWSQSVTGVRRRERVRVQQSSYDHSPTIVHSF